jgi:cysteine sulfinate desulfinase/cysteine desulfurase-like protein
MQCPPEVSRSTLRLSVGRENTADEIDEAARRIAAVVAGLRAPSA